MPVLRRRKTTARSSGAFRVQVGTRATRPSRRKTTGTTTHIDAWRYGWRRVLWDAMPVDPLEGRRPSVVEPMRPIETLAAARDER